MQIIKNPEESIYEGNDFEFCVTCLPKLSPFVHPYSAFHPTILFCFQTSSEFVTFTKLKENTEKWHLKRTTEGFAPVGHSVTDSELVDGRLTSQGHSVTDSELVDGRLTSQGYSRSTRL